MSEFDIFYPVNGGDGVEAADLKHGPVGETRGDRVTLPCGHIELVSMIRAGRNTCACDRNYIAVPRNGA